jgi:hypothetical protein
MVALKFEEDGTGTMAIQQNRIYRIEETIDKGFRIDIAFIGKFHSYAAGWHPTLDIAKQVCQLHDDYYQPNTK